LEIVFYSKESINKETVGFEGMVHYWIWY